MSQPSMDPKQSPPVAIDWDSEPTPAYATGVHVAPTMREFSVLFDESAPFPGRNAPPHDPRMSRSRIVASLRFAPETFFRVACALASSWNRFAQQALPPGAPRPRFRLIDSGDVQLDASEP